MKQRFLVEGMSCSACSAAVEKAVGRLEAVQKAEVNLLAKSMICEFEGGDETVAKILAAVQKAGFSATVWDDVPKSEPAAAQKENKGGNAMAVRLSLSAAFCVLLMYVAMGHMLHLPLTHWLTQPQHLAVNGVIQLLLCIPVLVLNRSFFVRGFKALLQGHANMDSLVAVGSGASVGYSLYALFRICYALGYGDVQTAADFGADLYFDSSAMILTLVTVGKALEERSKRKTGSALQELTALAPKFATVLRDGVITQIPLEDLQSGDLFLVHPGERIPADGVIVEGHGTVDESALTGESMPVEKIAGDRVLTACTNLDGALTVRAEQVGKETTLSHIIALVEQAGASKAPIARLADRVSGVFVPVVMSVALVTFLVWLFVQQDISFALARAVSVLVISCPCALGLATPVAMTVAMGKSASRGILIKNAETLELLHKTDTVIFDKTGTLTKGHPAVTHSLVCEGFTEAELLTLAASLERSSEHPLAKAILEFAANRHVKSQAVQDFRAVAGRGVQGVYQNENCLGGTAAFLQEAGIDLSDAKKSAEQLQQEGNTVLYFSSGSRLVGCLAVADEIRKESRTAIEELKKQGIRTVLLTGDHPSVANAVAREIGVDEVIAQVMPADKEAVVRHEQEKGHRVLMAGDGINDSPALARADLGCAMGGGTEIAMESADMVLLHDDPRDIPRQIAYSKCTMRNIRQNLFWAFFYNTLGIPVAAGVLFPAFGVVLNPMIGAAAMSLSSLFVVTNALRLYRGK